MRYEPNETHVATEIERMGSKHRFNTHGKNKKNSERKKNSDFVPERIVELDNFIQGKKESVPKKQDLSTITPDTPEQQLIKIFNENSHRKVYNPIDKTVDFSGRRSTDYKLNRQVTLPKSNDSLWEFECELRRRKYMEVFAKYKHRREEDKRNDIRTSQHNRKFFKKRKKDNIVISNE